MLFYRQAINGNMLQFCLSIVKTRLSIAMLVRGNLIAKCLKISKRLLERRQFFLALVSAYNANEVIVEANMATRPNSNKFTETN